MTADVGQVRESAGFGSPGRRRGCSARPAPLASPLHRQPGEPFADPAGLVGDPRHPSASPGAAGRKEVPKAPPTAVSGDSRARHRLPPGRPVGQAVRQLGEMNRVVAVRQQGPHSVADPDHAVRGGRRDPRQQARPPGPERLPPRLGQSPRAGSTRSVGPPGADHQCLLPVRPDRRAPRGNSSRPPHVARIRDQASSRAFWLNAGVPGQKNACAVSG